MSYTDSGGSSGGGNQGGYTGSGNPVGDFFSSIGTGLSNIFGGGTGSSDLASLAAQTMAGGAQGGQAPVQAADAIMQATDPTGAIGAQQVIAGGQGPTQTQQTQDPQGQGQQQRQGQQQQFAPQGAVDALKKAFRDLAQRNRQNPYQLGTDGPNSGLPNGSMLNRAARIPTGQVPSAPVQGSNPADLPSSDAQETMLRNLGAEGAGGQSEYGFDIPPGGEGESNQQEYGPGYDRGKYNPYPEGPDYQTEYGHELPTAPAGSPTTPRLPPPSPPAAPGSLGEIVQRLFGAPQQIEGLPPPGDPSSLIPPVGPWRYVTQLPTAIRAGPLLNQPQVDPSDPAQPMTPPRTPTPQGEKGYRPEDDPRADPAKLPKSETKPGPKDPAKRKHPDLPADHPKNRDPLPTKKGPEGEYQPRTGNARDKQWVPGKNRLMNDVSGVSTGVPMALGQLARFALPLMMMAMGGGFGGGRGRFRMGGRFGHPGGFGGNNWHPGGRGGWPYFHPQFGWRGHMNHPGGGWLPMHPDHHREFNGGGFLNQGGGVSPLAFAGGGGGNQQDGGQQGDDGPPPEYNQAFDKNSRYRNQDPPSSTVIGKGPDGQALPYTGQEAADFTDQVSKGLGIDPAYARRILAGESSYGQNYTNPNDTDGYPSYGPFQLHMKPGAMGWRFQQATGEDPRDPSTWRDQIVFALKEAAKSGWSQWGAARDNGIPFHAGIPRGGGGNFQWAYGKPGGGRTETGGTANANPDGNPPQPAQTQSDPEMGAAA